MTELLTNMTWPGAVAVLGSVITIVAGMLAVYATYVSGRKEVSKTTEQILTSALPSAEVPELHSRISALRDKVAEMDGETKVLKAKLESLAKQCEDHDKRDMDDFKTINAKVDKLLEIIVEMLRDE